MVFFRGASPVSFILTTSSRLLAKERKSMSKKVMSTIHLLRKMPEASPPASRRSTNPKATMHTSIMAYCFSRMQ